MRTIGICLLAVLPASSAILPNVEQVAAGVYAAGFADRYGSANCGWIVLRDSTLLVDPPLGVEIPAFLAEVARATGKPVTGIVLTADRPGDASLLEALRQAGVHRVETRGLSSLGDAGTPVDYLPYGRILGMEAGAVYLPRQKVLFAGPVAVNGPRAKLPGADTAAWRSALRDLQRIGPARVVPGYGSWGSARLLDRFDEFLGELRRQVAYGITMGRPLDAIQTEVRLPASYYVWTPYDTPLPEDIAWIYREMTCPRAPFAGNSPEPSDTRPHALVLIGDRYHEPEHLEAGLRPVFSGTGVIPHFTVDVNALTAANLAHVRLLVILRDGMLWPDGPAKPYKIWMTPEQERAVVDFVEAGGGFLNLHNSMGLYPANGPYLNLVGGRYIGHGPLERFTVEVVDRQHPITSGVTDFFAADEQHTPPYDEGKVHLLLRNRSDEGKVAAAGWAYEPGRGRLCHLASGHTTDALQHPMFQRLMQNAVRWCLRN
jgi:type 1 glutamine amidotransferase